VHLDIHSRKTGGAVRGFSLIELLIVMVLIIVMFTMYFGGGSRGFQTRQIAACAKGLDTMYIALKTYSLDNGGTFPALPGAQTSEPVLSLLIPKATTSTGCFICPGSKDKPVPDAESFATRKISFAYYMGESTAGGPGDPVVSDRQVNTNSKTAGQPLFSPDGKAPGNNHDKYGGNVLFCDGSVRSSPPAAAFDLTNAATVVLLNPNP
jgi:prepilin-type N-terminal cleavage/methylation domain-containing protein/prepilin-type processing-associated H-X9-DG protein